MNTGKLDHETIHANCPKSWEDFKKFYKTEFENYSYLKNIDFIQLPFEMQLGIFLKYFNENGVELDICNTEYTFLPQAISDAFDTYEKVISHYS